ncbi:hypothetical protein Tco_1353081 [Tanacetum coccineum]
MDDEPMLATNRVGAPTPGPAITIPETANEFAIKGQKPKPSLKKTVAFADKGNSNSDADKIMARMDVMTIKMDAQYKEIQSRARCNHCGETFMDLKTKLETTTKNHQASVQKLEANFDRFADKQSARPSGSLPSSTQPNPRDEESTPQPKSQNPKPTKETPTPKPYKPRIPYPQRLRKEKMEAQYGKFLDIIRAVHINVPLVDVLAGMLNYGKFLKELVSNKHKLNKSYLLSLAMKVQL